MFLIWLADTLGATPPLTQLFAQLGSFSQLIKYGIPAIQAAIYVQ